MAKRARILCLAGGLMAFLAVALLLGGSLTQPAKAEPVAGPPPVAVGRYQMSSFTITEGKTPGAYILDTQTGEVFQVVGKNPPERLGSVADVQLKK